MLSPLLFVFLTPLLSQAFSSSSSSSLAFSPLHAYLASQPGVQLTTASPSPLSAQGHTSPPLLSQSLKTRVQTIHRPIRPPSGPYAPPTARLLRLQPPTGGLWPSSDWEIDDSLADVVVPDLTDKATVVTLASIANDAYALPGTPRWLELDSWNISIPFGWEEDSIGLRGHVFADATNSTLIISIKGTSIDAPGPPQKGSTVRLDRINDNKLFSCCDGDCSARSKRRFPFSLPLPPLSGGAGSHEKAGLKKRKCDEQCVEENLWDDDSYYVNALGLYAHVRMMYPAANIWLVGHSLGGVVASLIGQTFGLPTVTFEAPPDRLASRRLHLHQPRQSEHHPVTHIYHTGDVFATSQCQGPLSICGRAGYVMESQCRTGNLIEYDTVGKWGWKVDFTGRSHTIQYCIDNVYSVDWNNGEKEGPAGRGRDWKPVPLVEDVASRGPCDDCGGYEFV